MKSFRLSIIAAVLFAASAAFAQYATINMPAQTFTGASGGITTNLGLGWSSSTIVTNINPYWSATNSPPSLLYSTNYSTNTVTSYADFDAIGADYITLQLDFNCGTASSVSNVIYSVNRSNNKLYFDTANTLWRTNAANGTTRVGDLFQIDMRGYPYGRITSLVWSNQAAQVFTNLSFTASKPKRNGGGATASGSN